MPNAAIALPQRAPILCSCAYYTVHYVVAAVAAAVAHYSTGLLLMVLLLVSLNLIHQQQSKQNEREAYWA